LVGSAAEVSALLSELRGELTLVVSGLNAPPAAVGPDASVLLAAARRLRLSDREAVEILRAAGMGRREAYGLVREER
jgi:hypothetical protein